MRLQARQCSPASKDRQRQIPELPAPDPPVGFNIPVNIINGTRCCICGVLHDVAGALLRGSGVATPICR